QATSGWDPKSTPYPSVRRDDIVFSYQSAAAHGNVTVADPYNYLEQSPASSNEVQTFIDQQRSFFKTYSKKFKDFDAIRESIKDAGHYDELQFPEAFGSKDNTLYTYHYRELGSDSRIFYVATQADLEQAYKTKFSPLPGKKVLDEASLGNDSIAFFQNISPDGKTFLYHASKKAVPELATIYTRDISNIFTDTSETTLKDSPEFITGTSDASDGWTSDSKGFFYMRNNASYDDGTTSIRYHKLGTPVQSDTVIVKPNNDPSQTMDFELSDDKKFIIVYVYNDNDKARVYVARLDQPISSSMKWTSIVPEATLHLEYVTNLENDFYFVAYYDNESNQVIKYTVDTNKARSVEMLKELTDKAIIEPTVIPEDKNALIDQFTVFDTDKMFLAYTQDAKRNYYIYDLRTGKRIQHVIPDSVGSASSITSLSTGSDIFLWSWTFNTPGQLYHIKWNVEKGSATSDLVYQAKLQSIDSSQFDIELKWATSKDSTKIPFHLFYRKGVKFDGTRPAMINFHGAFRNIFLASYSPLWMTWVNDYDAVFVLAYPRGGGEVRAEAWHQAGMLGNKQNTIDDVNAIIQYLIDDKIAAKGKVVLTSSSSGATNAMAVTNQAPEGNIGALVLQERTYGYALYDLLRFNTAPDSSGYVAEYGNPQDPQAFDWLRKISPLHNVDKAKVYPAILIFPGNDPVKSWSARKMIAELQYDLPNNPNPFFL
ncbi:prolyl oligopeptidase, partial [Meira miltonrushii]